MGTTFLLMLAATASHAPVPLLGFRYGRGRWNWYDLVLALLAAVIVYPDAVLDWLGERTGWPFSGWHVLLCELAAVALMAVAMMSLMPAYPRLQWWHALFYVGVIAVLRAAKWLVNELFGFGD